MFRSKSISFNPSKDIPSLTGKVILVTGGNIGLGKQSILEYVQHDPAKIYLAARSADKAQTAINDIQQKLASASKPPANITFLPCDLTSFESVKQAARTVLAESERLDILMLNAGVMAIPAGVTKEGYEAQSGTNYLGHALLAQLLTPLLENTAKLPGASARVVAVSSGAHRITHNQGIRFDTLKNSAESLNTYTRYGQSKLANILWARQFAKQYPQITAVSIHPGIVQTELLEKATGAGSIIHTLGKLLWYTTKSIEDGVKNQLWASVADTVKSGEYYEPVGVLDAGSPFTKDDKLAGELWEWMEKELQPHVSI